MKGSAYIVQSSYAKKHATLTQLYLELRLPLAHALQAAEADLRQLEHFQRDPALGSVSALHDGHTNQGGGIVA